MNLRDLKKGDIVQADPEMCRWGPCLVVVHEVKSWGIMGYTHVPLQGDAWIRLKWSEIEPTGGTAVWDVAPDVEEAGNGNQS